MAKTERDQSHRYRITPADKKYAKNPWGTFATLDDAREWVAENCEWVRVAQGVEAAIHGGGEIVVRDREETYTDNRDQPSRFGIAAESRDIVRRCNNDIAVEN